MIRYFYSSLQSNALYSKRMSATSDGVSVRFENVTKRFDRKTAVDNVSLEA